MNPSSLDIDFSIEGEHLTDENGISGRGWDDNWTFLSGSSLNIFSENGYLLTVGGGIGLKCSLSHPILLGESTFYVSFLTGKDAAGYFRIVGFDDEGRSRFGIHVDEDGKVGAQAAVMESAASFSPESLIKNDQTSMVVAKYSYEGGNGNMKIAVFENNESLPADEASVSWDHEATGGVTGLPLDYFRLAFSHPSVMFDEFKIGDTWKSVTENINFSFPPAAPKVLNSKSISANSLRLSWDDNALNEDGYVVLQDDVEVRTTGPDVTTYDVGGLSSGTKYSFGVYAKNTGSNSDTAEVEIKFMNIDPSALPKTEVQVVEQDQTSDSNSWSYKVTATGNYQIGMAWIWVSGEEKEVDLNIFIGDKLIKTVNVKSARAPYRFETRLEDLAVDDVIKVTALPKEDASYQLGYKIVYGAPVFTDMPVFDVQEFGAAGDGVTNDYQAIYNAISARNNSHAYVFGEYSWNGDSEIVPDKCYKDESSTITFDKRVKYPLDSPPFLERDVSFVTGELNIPAIIPEKGKLTVRNVPEGIHVNLPEPGGQLSVLNMLGQNILSKTVYGNHYPISNQILGKTNGIVLINYRLNDKYYSAKVIRSVYGYY